MYKKLREPINSITHLAGAGLSLLALIAIRSINEYNNCAKKTTNTISWLSYIPAILVGFIHILPI